VRTIITAVPSSGHKPNARGALADNNLEQTRLLTWRKRNGLIEELSAELERLASFHHNLDLPHQPSTFLADKSRRPVEKTRVSNLVKHASLSLLDACGGSCAGKRVLDVACNCGGFTFEAAKHGADHVLGFGLVEHYLEEAALIKRANEAERVEFRNLNIEDLDETDVGRFDVTFCFGIL
jgi:2-polyprenyl-3-methyl-5-hydroxy-6-metoxy-1,4-benzoquinol methylase